MGLTAAQSRVINIVVERCKETPHTWLDPLDFDFGSGNKGIAGRRVFHRLALAGEFQKHDLEVDESQSKYGRQLVRYSRRKLADEQLKKICAEEMGGDLLEDGGDDGGWTS